MLSLAFITDGSYDLRCSVRLIALDVSSRVDAYPIVDLIVSVVESKVLNDALHNNGCFELIDESNKVVPGLFL